MSHRSRQRFAPPALAGAHARGSDRHADVEEDGVAARRDPGCERVGSHYRGRPAEGRDDRVTRVRRENEHEMATPGRSLDEGGKAPDMVAAADRHRPDPEFVRSGACLGDRLRGHPDPGEAPRVPAGGSPPGGEHVGLPFDRHLPGFQLLDILRKEGETVGGVPVEVRFDQALGDHLRPVAGHADRLEHARRECPELAGVESGRDRRSIAVSGISGRGHESLRLRKDVGSHPKSPFSIRGSTR